MRAHVTVALVAGLFLAACSSKPREFTPQLATAAPDPTQFDAAVASCKELYVAGKLDGSGRLASGGAGAAAGGAVGALGSAAAASAGLYGGMAVATATVVLIPVAIVGGAFGMAKIKRHKKEAAVQRAMSGCLHDHGYEVASWQKTPKAKRVAEPGLPAAK